MNGLKENIKTLYNTPDSNFKFISFPIKYNLIVHPLYPNADNFKLKKENIRINKNISEFSYLDIFTYSVFILSYLTLITFFLNKIYNI